MPNGRGQKEEERIGRGEERERVRKGTGGKGCMEERPTVPEG